VCVCVAVAGVVKQVVSKWVTRLIEVTEKNGKAKLYIQQVKRYTLYHYVVTL